MKWRLILASYGLSAVTLCSPIYAQNSRTNNQQSDQHSSRARSNRQQSDARRMVERYDNNDDGVLQKSELPQTMRGSFSRLDRDENGELSASELREHAKQMQRSIVPVEVVCVWVSDVDQGRLSMDDLQTAYDTLLEIDDNNDGKISQRELQQRRQELASKWAKQVINRLDENDDGLVDQDEAEESFIAGNFDRIDINEDGEISRNELQRNLASNQHGEQQENRSARRSEDHTR